MESNPIEALELVGSVASYDFSMISLFLRADLVVKLVILLLLSASVWCWAIIIEKSLSLRRLNGHASQFESNFWSGGSLDDLFDRIGSQPKDPMAAVFASAMQEWRRARSRETQAGIADLPRGGLSERVDRVMRISINREMNRVERYMTVLASTGSTAPFIGLFGTVWGIMQSFQAIAQANNTSLAVVAPGLAEALFATALGLLAAIPAVVAFNKLTKELDRYGGRLDTFADEFGAILSRQLEERSH
ncbi:MAG: protein TolQ [Rhodospirillales bacterium]|jgi:biopolymer transport protein TolQ